MPQTTRCGCLWTIRSGRSIRRSGRRRYLLVVLVDSRRLQTTIAPLHRSHPSSRTAMLERTPSTRTFRCRERNSRPIPFRRRENWRIRTRPAPSCSSGPIQTRCSSNPLRKPLPPWAARRPRRCCSLLSIPLPCRSLERRARTRCSPKWRLPRDLFLHRPRLSLPPKPFRPPSPFTPFHPDNRRH